MTEQKVLLCKTNDDVCVYVDTGSFEFECGHYFRGLSLCGASWSGGSHLDISYDNVRTPLSRADYERLLELDKEITTLGYGLDKDEEKQAKGYELRKEAKAILNNKLDAPQCKEFFDEIIAEEVEYMKEHFNLDDADIEEIFDNYGLEYRDREIICCIFDSVYDCGYEEALNFGYVKRNDSVSEKYFDFEQFGQDLVDDDEAYVELKDGRVAYLCY